MTEQTKPPAPEGQPSVFEDIKVIFKAADNIKLLISLPSLSIPAIIEKLTETVKAPVEMWKMLVQTLPISLSVAIVGMGFFGDRKNFSFLGAFWIFSLTLGLTSWVGNQLNLPGTVPVEWWKLLLWPIFIVLSPGTVGRLIDDYYNFYGPKLFYSSIGVGLFLAWFWSTRILPRFEKEDKFVVTEEDRKKFAAAFPDMQEKRNKDKDSDKTTSS